MKQWGADAMILVFLIFSSKLAFSLSSFTRIRRFFSSALLSAVRVESFTYLRLLMFLPAILLPPCDSSSLAFHMIYSSYVLNKQGDNIEPWHTPFPILNQFIFPCPVLTTASCRIKFSQEAGQVVWYSHLFKNVPQFVVIHTVKALA